MAASVKRRKEGPFALGTRLVGRRRRGAGARLLGERQRRDPRGAAALRILFLGRVRDAVAVLLVAATRTAVRSSLLGARPGRGLALLLALGPREGPAQRRWPQLGQLLERPRGTPPCVARGSLGALRARGPLAPRFVLVRALLPLERIHKPRLRAPRRALCRRILRRGRRAVHLVGRAHVRLGQREQIPALFVTLSGVGVGLRCRD